MPIIYKKFLPQTSKLPETAIVLLNGDGFDGPKWSVRASLANLDKKDYLTIGAAIRKIFDQYHTEYTQASK